RHTISKRDWSSDVCSSDLGYFFKNLKDGKVESHPNTFEKFQDFKIPFYNESCELAINLHESLYGIHSIGWDIAITPDGPLIIKGNYNLYDPLQQLFYKIKFLSLIFFAKLKFNINLYQNIL